MRIGFTDRELDVMSVLWDLGDATVTEVRQRLADKLAYTTVLTVLRTLEQKGYVDHTGEGRAHRYHPLVKREAVSAGKPAAGAESPEESGVVEDSADRKVLDSGVSTAAPFPQEWSMLPHPPDEVAAAHPRRHAADGLEMSHQGPG